MTDQADYPPLRPCPFCGKVPVLIRGRLTSDHYEILCNFPCGKWVIGGISKAEAADKWNRRAKL